VYTIAAGTANAAITSSKLITVASITGRTRVSALLITVS